MNRQPKDTIPAEKSQEEQANELIERSGHNLHVQVANSLAAGKYRCKVSPYYVDAYSNTPREVDLIATKAITDDRHYDSLCDLVLTIDCKYLNGPSVFWMFENTKQKEALKIANTDYDFVRARTGEHAFMWFKAPRIARLFQGTDRDKSESNRETIFRACQQVINGTILARNLSTKPSFIYPVVVVDGPGSLFEADNTTQPLSRVIVHLDYSYRSLTHEGREEREPFYVIITRKDELENLCVELEKEAQALLIYERDKEERRSEIERESESLHRRREEEWRADAGL